MTGLRNSRPGSGKEGREIFKVNEDQLVMGSNYQGRDIPYLDVGWIRYSRDRAIWGRDL